MMFEYKAKVESVLDGDTIDVSIDLGFFVTYHTRVRFYGINAPEIHSRSKEEKEAGFEAKAKLTELVGGKTVKLRTVKPNQEGGGDKFGRFLAEVWLTEGMQQKSVNQQLIDLGLVKPWDGKGKKPV